MPSNQALESVSRLLKNIAPSNPDYVEVADFLTTVRIGQAEVVYACGTHATHKECEVQNLIGFQEFLKARRHRLHLDDAAREYVTHHGHHMECHS